MHTQPRNFDSQITELPSSRCRVSSAVGGNGEASAPAVGDVPASGGAALDLLLERSRTLAARVRSGQGTHGRRQDCSSIHAAGLL
jgi:hypothetical protein